MRQAGSLLLSGAVAMCLVVLAGSTAQAQDQMKPKGEAVSLTNAQVIDLHCYTAGGIKGDMHKECAVACAKAGVPLGILSADGKVYVPVSKSPMADQNEKLIPHAEQLVNVTGRLYTRDNILGIEIESIEAAKG